MVFWLLMFPYWKSFQNLVFGNISTSSIDLLGQFCPPYWHIWLQHNTYYYRQHLYGQTREIIIIPYQWLNVETRECPSPVRKCREQWRGTAAHGLLKCLSLNFEQAFSKTGFMFFERYFSELCIRTDEYFPWFCTILSFNWLFGF